jgi:hypothetical protein
MLFTGLKLSNLVLDCRKSHPVIFTHFLVSPKGEMPTLQTGSFAKIAHRAIFRRSALPWGKAGKGVNQYSFNSLNISPPGIIKFPAKIK